MHPILSLSIGLRLAALVWSLVVARRVHDLRMLFMSAMLALMATRQLLTLRSLWERPGEALQVNELPGLVVSVMAFAAVVFLGRLLQERQDTERALRASETQFRSLVEHALDIIALVDGQGRCVYASPSIESTLGYRPEELAGEDLSRYVAPGDLSRIATVFEELARQPGQGRRARFSVVHRDGTPHPVEMSVVAVPGPGGELQYFLDVRDNREEQLADQERRRLEAQLFQSQKMETIGSLAGGIAHDFNNLLTPIVGNTELVRERLPPDSPLQALLAPVLDAAARARDLVRQILLFGRKADKRSEPVSLPAVAESSLALVRASIPAGIRVESRIDAVTATVLGDEVQLQQVLINLCTNASHAMRESGGTLTLSLDAVEPDEALLARLPGLSEHTRWWRLSVGDTGTGMDADTLARVFEPFFSTKPVGEGSGLGLAVAHGIVARHGGSIDVESTPGAGTTFHVYLPASAAEVRPRSSDKPMRRDGVGRVLFIDDEPSVYAIGRLLLEQLGYEAVCASGGDEAIEIFADDPNAFDVVVTDQAMPGMTGTELARRLRELRADLPIVLTTGFAGLDVTAQLEVIGIRHVLAKPYTVEELSVALQAAMGR